MNRVFKQDVRVDFSHLHFEWAIQPELTNYYGEQLAEAKRKVDRTEEAVDVAKAKATEEAFGKGLKVDAAKADAEKNSEYRKAVSSYNQARYESNLAQAAFDAIQTKKYALENLVRLHGQEYFAMPVEPKEYEDWKGKRFSEESAEKTKEQAQANCRAAAAQRRVRRT